MKRAYAIVLSAALVGPLVSQGGFRPGDIYLHSSALVNSSSTGGGLMRIDPISGTTQILLNYPSSAGLWQSMAYDPYRDRLIGYVAVGTPILKLYALTSTGSPTDLGLPADTYSLITPRGDGIVYLRRGSTQQQISYLDAANGLHTLNDATGTTPFSFPASATSAIPTLYYHRAQNALYAAVPSGTATCTGGASTDLSIYRAPLSIDGTRVVGTVTCAQAVVDPLGSNQPVCWSLTADGSLLLVVDTNSNAAQPRMLSIDPVTLTASIYASNGSYTGAAATNAGFYSTVRDAAIVLDTFSDVLRIFTAGSTGGGSQFATGVSSPGGSGEVARLFEIEPTAVSLTLHANSSSISLQAGGTDLLTFAPGPAFSGEIAVVAASQSGWTPGIPYGFWVIPLVYDALTTYSIANANSVPFVNNAAVLGSTGVLSTQFVVPPNAPPGFAGTTVYFAGIAATTGGVINHVSNPAALSLVP